MIGVPNDGLCLLPIRASAKTYMLEAALMPYLISHLTVNRTTTHGLNYTSFCNNIVSTTLLSYLFL